MASSASPSPAPPMRLVVTGTRAEIILNDGQYNLLTALWVRTLETLVDSLAAHPTVRVVLLHAEGPLFTAGLDLNSLSSLMADPKGSRAVGSSRFRAAVTAMQRPFTKLALLPQPVIMAIHGKCIGGGVDLIVAGDLRVCTQDTTFAVKETQAGMVADLGTIPRLTRIVGQGLYNEMLFTGDFIDSQRALASGLVNTVYESQAAMLVGARQLCDRIAANSPLVVAGAKRVLRYAEEHTVDESLDYVALWNTAFIESEDLREAVMAFMAKRKPVFKNRL